MPRALYGFLFLSDCTYGSYRDGSHALRWEQSAHDHGLLPCHLTHPHAKDYMYKHTLSLACMLTYACTHPHDGQGKASNKYVCICMVYAVPMERAPWFQEAHTAVSQSEAV